MKRLWCGMAAGLWSTLAVAAVKLPFWYEVEYLEAHGQQYVDTEIQAATNVETWVGYQYLGTVNQSGRLDMIGGARGRGGQQTRYYPVSLCGGLTQERYVFGDLHLTKKFAAAARHNVQFNDSQHQVWLDGVCVGTLTNQLGACDNTMLIFAANSEHGPDWYSCSRIWHYDIWVGRQHVRSLVPVVDEKGEACFYDRPSNRLFRNAGKGKLTAGPIYASRVDCNLVDRADLLDGTRIISFTSAPAATTAFALDAQTAKRFDPVLRWDGVYLAAKDPSAVVAAKWTGAAKDGNPENPANWQCRRADGTVVPQGLPSDRTTVEVTGETNLQAPVDKNLAFATLKLSGTVRLTSDCDWRGFGWIVLPRGVKLDLNGHRLQTARLSRYDGGFSPADVKAEDCK